MGTRQTFKTTDVLRLEVAQTPTGLYNLVKNPPDLSFPAANGWGWITDLTDQPVTVEVPATAVPAATWLKFTVTGGFYGAIYTEDWSMSAGEWVAARLRHAVGAGVTSWIRFRFQWFTADGAHILPESAQSAYALGPDIAAGTPSPRTLAAQQAPAGTARARLRIDFYGNNTGGVPSGGANYFNEVTVAKAATSGALSGLGYISAEPAWTDVLGPTHSISVKRSGLNVGTLAAEILDATLDPALSTLIRPGKRVRLMALDNAAATWSPVFTGWIARGQATYDATRTDAKRARISLTAVDSIAKLAQVQREIAVTQFGMTWKPLEGAGVPFQLGATVKPATTYPTPPVGILDQLGMIRDSEHGYAWVNRFGVLWLLTPAQFGHASVTTLNESKYSDVGIGYDTDRCINTVLVKVRTLDALTGQTVDVPYGPFVDQTSVDRWGAHSADFTVVGIANDPTAAAAWAASVLAANATPAVRINTAEIPIRDAADIVAGKALLDLYDQVTVVNTNAGLSQSMRVTDLEHRIENGKWQLGLEFSEPANVERATRGGGAPGRPGGDGIPVANTTDTGWLRPGDVGGPAWGVGWGDWSDTANAYVAMKRTGTNVKVAGLGRRTSGSGTTMLILPPGCRLANGKNSWHPCEVNNAPGVCVVDGSGNVLIQSAVTNGQHVAVFIDFDTDQP